MQTAREMKVRLILDNVFGDMNNRDCFSETERNSFIDIVVFARTLEN